MANDRKTGEYGALSINGTTVPFQSWTFQDANTSNTIVNAATKGGTARQPGAFDWNGSFVVQSPTSIVFCGDIVDWSGYTAPDDGEEGSAGTIYTGDVYIESVQLTIDWENNTPITTTYTFSGDGPYAESSGAMVDASTFSVLTAADIGIDVTPAADGVSGDECYLNVKNLQLTFSRPSASITDSCSYTLKDGKYYVFRKRQRGTAMDITGSMVVNSYASKWYPKRGTDFTLNLTNRITSAAFWSIAFMQIENVTGLTVSRSDTTTILSQTLGLVWNAVKSDGTLGSVKFGAVDYWPNTPTP